MRQRHRYEPKAHPSGVDWMRLRTVGIDLMIVGALVLLISLGLALDNVCPAPTTCSTRVDWATLSPSLALLAVGAFTFYMSRRKTHKVP